MRILMAVLAVAMFAAVPAQAKGSYASVNGLKMYYEIHGKGQPVVLLHGGMSTIEKDFGKIIPVLAKSRQVIAIEQQAHGRTADIDRPLTLKQMADDTAALLRHLKIENADFYGYSVGGGIAMQIAIRYRPLVRKLVIATPSYDKEGYAPGFFEAMANFKPELVDGSPWHKAYTKVAPKPDGWRQLVIKVTQSASSFENIPPETLQAIKAPALLVLGDSDIVLPEHAAKMARLLNTGLGVDATGTPYTQLAVLPGTNHAFFVDRADWLASMIQAFLDAPMPKAK